MVRWTEQQLREFEARKARPRLVDRDRTPETQRTAAARTGSAVGATTPGGEGVGNSPHKTPRRHIEDDLQRQVAQFLDWALIEPDRWLHVPNGGKRDKATAGILKAFGLKPGAADVLILRPPPLPFVWIELKAPKGVLSDDQKDWRSWAQSIGAPWFCCRSLDEVVAACEDAGVPLLGRPQ